MPTIRQMYHQMMTIENTTNHEPGYYPIMFKNDWERYKFAKYCQWRSFMERIKKLCHI